MLKVQNTIYARMSWLLDMEKAKPIINICLVCLLKPWLLDMEKAMPFEENNKHAMYIWFVY